MPLWIANDVIDGIVVIDGWAQSKEGRRAEARGKRGDKIMFPSPLGAGRWREHIYNQMLNAGLRVPPVAGSGSGLFNSPFGDARVYASASESSWWESLLSSETFVTNGPLLRASIGGQPPGTTFHLEPGETLELEIALNLATRDLVDYLEILKDGEVLHSVRLAEWAKQNGRLPAVEFDASGWVAVRAVTENQEMYQFARTAPFWVVSSKGPRVDLNAVKFFQGWLEDAATRFEQDAPGDYEAARSFWRHYAAETND